MKVGEDSVKTVRLLLLVSEPVAVHVVRLVVTIVGVNRREQGDEYDEYDEYDDEW